MTVWNLKAYKKALKFFFVEFEAHEKALGKLWNVRKAFLFWLPKFLNLQQKNSTKKAPKI